MSARQLELPLTPAGIGRASGISARRSIGTRLPKDSEGTWPTKGGWKRIAEVVGRDLSEDERRKCQAAYWSELLFQ